MNHAEIEGRVIEVSPPYLTYLLAHVFFVSVVLIEDLVKL